MSYLDGYNAALPAAQQTRTPIEASTSSIQTRGRALHWLGDEPGATATLPQVMASVDGASQSSTITYRLVRDDSGLFLIVSGTGEINLDGRLDYETASSHTLTVGLT